jgi:hypothetical protein
VRNYSSITVDSLPEPLVQRTDLCQQPNAVGVFEIEQFVQTPVQMVCQECEFPPEFVGGVPS